MAFQPQKYTEINDTLAPLGNASASLVNAANDIIDDVAIEMFSAIDGVIGKAGSKVVVQLKDSPRFDAKLAIKGDAAQVQTVLGYLVGAFSGENEDSIYYSLTADPRIRVQKQRTIDGNLSTLPGNSQTVSAAIEKIVNDGAAELWSQLQQYGPPNLTAGNFNATVSSVVGNSVVYTIVEV